MLEPVLGNKLLYRCQELYQGNIRTFLYESNAGIDVMMQPEKAGMYLAESMTKAAADFWLALFWLELKEGRSLPEKSKIVEYILLTGGKYYFLREGLWELSKNYVMNICSSMDLMNGWIADYASARRGPWLGKDDDIRKKVYQYFDHRKLEIQQIYLGVRREEIHRGEWAAQKYYNSIEYIPDSGFIVSGDTIASGITACESVAHIYNYYLMKGMQINRLVINSVFASERGIKRLVEYTTRNFPDLCMDIFVCGALLDMDMENQTDLRFFSNGQWQIPTVQDVIEVYPVTQYLLKCLTEDWGTRNKHPRLYHLGRKDEYIKWEEKLNSEFEAAWLTDELRERLLKDLQYLKYRIEDRLK